MLTQSHWLLVLVKSDVWRWEEEELGDAGARLNGSTVSPVVFGGSSPSFVSQRGRSITGFQKGDLDLVRFYIKCILLRKAGN